MELAEIGRDHLPKELVIDRFVVWERGLIVVEPEPAEQHDRPAQEKAGPEGLRDHQGGGRAFGGLVPIAMPAGAILSGSPGQIQQCVRKAQASTWASRSI